MEPQVPDTQETAELPQEEKETMVKKSSEPLKTHSKPIVRTSRGKITFNQLQKDEIPPSNQQIPPPPPPLSPSMIPTLSKSTEKSEQKQQTQQTEKEEQTTLTKATKKRKLNEELQTSPKNSQQSVAIPRKDATENLPQMQSKEKESEEKENTTVPTAKFEATNQETEAHTMKSGVNDPTTKYNFNSVKVVLRATSLFNPHSKLQSLDFLPPTPISPQTTSSLALSATTTTATATATVTKKQPSFINYKQRKTIKTDGGNWLKQIKWSPDGNLLLSTSNDRCLRLFMPGNDLTSPNESKQEKKQSKDTENVMKNDRISFFSFFHF